MTLAEFVAKHKRETFDQLRAGENPSQGEFDEALLAEGRTKGEVRMGPAVLSPQAIELQFLYGTADPTILVVRIAPPERIVFLPVPDWVIANVWQGEVLGSPHFESDAAKMLAAFQDRLEPERNIEEFNDSLPIGRH